jgi:lycopene beta-cyclase
LTTDVLLVGGGLANSLIAWRLLGLQPGCNVTILEQAGSLGGNHTWSFHETDLTAGQRDWLAPLIEHRWSNHEVRFPGFRRQLAGAYCSISSHQLHRMVSVLPGLDLQLGVAVREVDAYSVRLQDGRTLTAPLVIDGRGFQPGVPFDLRYQKFLGQVVSLREPHELSGPILMDATVSQRDGYRFVYVLPFGARRLLIEDTYYSDAAELPMDMLRAAIADYARAQGWRVDAVEREETGVLPIMIDGNIKEFWREANPELPRVGLRAMLFHHTTGFSLPEAVRTAQAVATAPDLRSAAVAAMIRSRAQLHWREQRIFRMLNRMLFNAAAPGDRYRVLEHFYRLPEAAIARFYAGVLQAGDVARVLTGRPPVPVHRALRALLAPSQVPRPGRVPAPGRPA